MGARRGGRRPYGEPLRPPGAAPGRPQRVRVVAAGRGGGGGAGRGRDAGDRAAGAADRPCRGDHRDHGRAGGDRGRRPVAPARGRCRRRCRRGAGRRPARLHDPGPGLPGAGRDRRHGAVPGKPRLPPGPARGADPGRAAGHRHQAGDRRRAPGAVHPDRGDPAGGAADQAAVLQRRAAAGQGRPDRHLRRRGPPRPRPAAGRRRPVRRRRRHAGLRAGQADGRQRRPQLHHPPVRAGILPAL